MGREVKTFRNGSGVSSHTQSLTFKPFDHVHAGSRGRRDDPVRNRSERLAPKERDTASRAILLPSILPVKKKPNTSVSPGSGGEVTGGPEVTETFCSVTSNAAKAGPPFRQKQQSYFFKKVYRLVQATTLCPLAINDLKQNANGMLT